MEKETSKKRDYLLPVSILTTAILIIVALIYSTGAKSAKTAEQQANIKESVQAAQKSDVPQIGNETVLGNPDAAVTIFIFSDYQCPFCSKFFEQTEKLIRKNYVDTGKANMVYKDLAFLGPESTAAAQAADCAADQGKYWQYHDALFEAEYKDGQENNDNLNREFFKKTASDLQMDTDEFLSCLDSSKYADEVKQDAKEGKSLMEQVSTPTIFVNEKMIQGAYPYSVFSDIIDKYLIKN